MTKKEWHRLRGYMIAKIHRPTAANHSFQGRNLVKGRAKGVGQVLVNSRVKPQVRLER